MSQLDIDPTRKLLVMGNGPSLKDFDFFRTSGVDTLGMNAAYRYWDRIGWYPTHYCCVDDQLIETHHAEILRLLREGQVKSIFTLAKIIEYQPEMANMEGVYFREQFHGTLAQRLAAMGSDKPWLKHPAFFVSNGKKLTTGAFAVRFGMYLGYSQIGLMGIDLKYVEILKEAKPTEGLGLVIAEDVKENPNYFFDDYQRKGDKYNIPNPSVHDGNLHIQAFEVLRDDLAIQKQSTDILNLNKKSRLHDLGIFPYEAPSRFLGEAGIGAVCVPTTHFEIDDILNNFRLWDMPAYHPVLRHSEYGRQDLVFIFSQEPGEEIRQKIQAAWDETVYVKEMFAGDGPVIVSAELDSDADVYKREYFGQSNAAGYKSGPNLQFFASMRLMGERYGDFVFFMETDCAPVRPGWLTTLNAMAKGDRESWLIGSLYKGAGSINRSFFMHLNGNGIYRVGSPDFQAFLSDVWEPLLMDVIAKEDPRAAYDCVLSRYWSSADSHKRNEAWQSFQKYASRFRFSEAVQNISGAVDLTDCEGVRISDYLAQSELVQVVHGRQFARSLYDFIGEEWVSPGTKRLKKLAKKGETKAPAFARESALEYTVIPEGKSRRTGEDTYHLESRDGQYAQVMFIFNTRIDPENVYTAVFDVEVSTDCMIQVGVCRHGQGAYEGGSHRTVVKAGRTQVSVTHRFGNSHARLRGQLVLVEGEAEIKIHKVDLKMDYGWWPEAMRRSEPEGSGVRKDELVES